jgi:hypothetical protein
VTTDAAHQQTAVVEHPVCCEELTAIDGGYRFDRGCWTLELADAATATGERWYAFYVMVDDTRIDLVVDERPDGTPYLRPLDPTAAGEAVPLPRLNAPDDAGAGAYARPVSSR